MAQFTGRERVRAAFKKQWADRVPFYPILGHFSAQLLPITVREFLTDAEKCAAAQLRFYELFKPDIIVMVGDLLKEAEALGNKLSFPDDSMCITKKPALQDKADLLKLKVPDPLSAARMPLYMEACRIVKGQIKDSSVGGNISGPWTIAIGLRDAQPLIKDCLKDPAFVHAVMEFTTEVCRVFSLALASTGVGVSIGEPTASCSLVSPRLYRRFILPYHQKLFSALHSQGVYTTMHVCGYTDPILEDLIATGTGGLSIDFPSSLPRLVELAQDKVVVFGNVNTRLFYQGSREEMETDVKRCIEAAAKYRGFILSTGCEVPYIATLERLRWFMEAGEKFGTYPSQVA